MRNTLAGEASAADSASDHGYFCACFFSELLYGESVLDGKCYIPMYNITDCKSLYDAVQKDNPTVSEKRTLIDILSLKQHLSDGGLRWVLTDKQVADGFTKDTLDLRRFLTAWCNNATVQLHE